MNKFIASISIWSLAIAVGVLVMIYGWGLTPVSWWWIIGGGIIIRLIVEFMGLLLEME